MSNTVIVLILILLLYSGSKIENYRIHGREIPWWILVTLGFTVSCLGLFYFNDDRVILSGCLVLFVAKLYSHWDRKNWESEEAEPKQAKN